MVDSHTAQQNLWPINSLLGSILSQTKDKVWLRVWWLSWYVVFSCLLLLITSIGRQAHTTSAYTIHIVQIKHIDRTEIDSICCCFSSHQAFQGDINQRTKLRYLEKWRVHLEFGIDCVTKCRCGLLLLDLALSSGSFVILLFYVEFLYSFFLKLF